MRTGQDKTGQDRAEDRTGQRAGQGRGQDRTGQDRAEDRAGQGRGQGRTG
jgi:hypothetical protein